MRKSKQQRIIEGNALIAAIKQDSVLASEQTWLIHFIGDLVSKFKRGKGGTSRQRTLFDEKIVNGVPSRIINTHIAQPEVVAAEAAIKLLQLQPNLYSWEIRVGGEIVSNGLRFNLSAKQLTLLSGFVEKAKQVEAQSQMTVNPETQAEAQLLIDLAGTYIGLTAKKSKDIDILRSAISQGIGFSDNQLKDGQTAVSGELKKYNKLKGWYTPGMLVRYRHAGKTNEMALVIDGPQVSNVDYVDIQKHYGRASKSIRIPVMVDGQLVLASTSHVSRYTKKELKRLGAE